MPTISLARARAELIAAGITGPHQSHSRDNVVKKIRSLLGPEPDETFGISDLGAYGDSEVLGFLADITGCWRDVQDCEGYDQIDPDKTIEGIVAMGNLVRDAAIRGATLVCATGHPTGMLECYMRIVQSFRRAGGKVLRPREREDIPWKGSKIRQITYVGGVGMWSDWGNLLHTHSAHPMEAMLTGTTWPDLVLGDHGFAGAAIERGIPTIAIMDINDIAFAIASARGHDVTLVPLDDNRPPAFYEPVWTLVEEILEG